MHVSSGKPFMVRGFTHKLYLIMASVILPGIVAEGVLIGPSLFADTSFGRAIHGDLGALLFLLTLLLPVVGRLAHLPGRMTLLNAGLLALSFVQVISAALGRRSPVMAALHPATALLMAVLAGLLLIQAWQVMRQRKSELQIPEGTPS